MPEVECLNNKKKSNCGVSNRSKVSRRDSILRSFSLQNMEDYKKLYEFSVENPELFWENISKDFTWRKKPSGKILKYNFDLSQGAIDVRWMDNAETNICFNAVDRNVQKGLGNKIAFYWEGNDVDDSSTITYNQLLQQVCKFANVLKSKGIQRGDRVTLYMPMILELVVSMLACARIGAIHNVVFGGFSSDSLSERILDSRSTLLVTADGAWRGTKLINLKEIADSAIDKCRERELTVRCIVVRHLSKTWNANINGLVNSPSRYTAKRPIIDFQVPWSHQRDSWWHEEMSSVSSSCDTEWLKSEHPLFILYTSGSTGKPKGVLHTTAGYMLYTATTFQHAFAYKPDDVYFCTADIGWITGHSYGVYGPLLKGATCVMFQGIPTHPDPGRYWTVCEKYKVSKFYTAPTAIRSLMKFGDSYVTKYNLDSLKVLGTVGEPINPEAWQWYHEVVGGNRCAVIDTYWQSETGGHVITPLPDCTPLKPGSACFPFFGVVPAIVNDQGNELEGPCEGHLVFKKPWPGMTRTIYGDHDRFESTYFSRFPGYYCTGDGARRDSDGYYWITGRTDDMLNVSGHLLSTAEVESALIEHEACAEAAAVSQPHNVKGECLYCYVVLKESYASTKELIFQLKEKVRSKIGTFASPEYIHFTPSLPKTRSGKIMRRVLRKISRNEQDLGDLSTLAEQSVIDELYATKPSTVTEGDNGSKIAKSI